MTTGTATRTVVVGAGPVGLYCAMVLARSGHRVSVVERDPFPLPDRRWSRRGVMQFNLPHFFRPIVRQALVGGLPDVWDAVLAAGGVPARPDGFPEEMAGLHCRRSTFERALWSVANVEAGLSWQTGRAERLLQRGDRVSGVVVDGVDFEADVVIVAAGRADRFAEEYRGPGEGGSCGFSYVARMYRARDGGATPSSAFPIGSVYEGYQAIVFPRDDGTLSVLVVRPTADSRLASLRHNDCFAAAAAKVPTLAPWTDPSVYEPITDAMAGSGLSNTYRGQLDGEGNLAVSGLFFVGDRSARPTRPEGEASRSAFVRPPNWSGFCSITATITEARLRTSRRGVPSTSGLGTTITCIRTQRCCLGSQERTLLSRRRSLRM